MEQPQALMLEAEGAKIYRILFADEISADMSAKFKKAIVLLQHRFGPQEIASTARVLARISDWEALEMAARWRGRLPILIEKFKIMLYLGETVPENYTRLVNEKPQRFWGWATLTGAGIRSAWKLLKGWVLLSRSDRGKNDV